MTLTKPLAGRAIVLEQNKASESKRYLSNSVAAQPKSHAAAKQVRYPKNLRTIGSYLVGTTWHDTVRHAIPKTRKIHFL